MISIERFRPNLVIAGPLLEPFSENSWRRVSFSASEISDCEPLVLTSEGLCTRCAMVNVDQNSAQRRSLLFRTLALQRRHRQASVNNEPEEVGGNEGRITFGVLLAAPRDVSYRLRVGMHVHASE